MMFAVNRFNKVIFICLLILLTACQPKSPLPSAMNQYQSRLGRVLAMEFEQTSSSSQTFESKNNLKVKITPIEINLREFYAINGCKLATLVANRNSTLGKVQLPSQRFIYERNLLNTFTPCIEKITLSNPTLANKLIQLKKLKEQSYLANWVNMFQQSDEIYSALTRTHKFIIAGNSGVYEQGLQDWSWLISLQSINPKQSGFDSRQKNKLEQTLQRIEKSRLPASLWESERFIHHILGDINNVLSTQLPLVSCKGGIPSEQAKILRNVFVLFFVQKIQPIGSSINNVHYSLIPIMEALPTTTLSSELKGNIEAKMTTDFLTYQTTTKEHVRLWQALFKRCNLLPVRPTN